MAIPNKSPTTILLIEDDPAIVAMLTDALDARGYHLRSAVSAAEAEHLVDDIDPAVILLDLMLPDMSGLLLCANLRAKTGVPIIVCSARTHLDDRLLGFKLGADDFLGKPFSVDELVARIEAVLRRATPPVASVVASHPDHHVLGPLMIDQTRCRVTLGGDELHLTPTEYRLLCILASRAGQVFSRAELAEPIWRYYDPDVGRTLDVHMRRLRAKLANGVQMAPTIITVRGFGYQLFCEYDEALTNRS